MNPLETNRALHLSIDPLAWYLTLYTHLHPMGTFPCGKSTLDQVWLSSRALISAAMASFQHCSLDV